MKKSFLFIQKYMNIGGIETTLYREVKTLLENNIRVIWIKPKGGSMDDSFNKVMLSNKIERYEIDLANPKWLNKLNIKFDMDEFVYARVSSLFYFILLEKIKRKYKNIQIHSVYWVPHFMGKNIFLEYYAPKLIRPVVKYFLRKLIILMDQNNNILYGTKSHANAYMLNYNYKIFDLNSKLDKNGFIQINPKFNCTLSNVSNYRKIFKIITITRFDFPHKAYILGLIEIFKEIVLRHPNIDFVLEIIGYGEDEHLLINIISALPVEIKNRIILHGKVSYDQLPRYFKNATLNVGMAGSLILGARAGLVSIPVRHYSDSCEAYGFLPKANDFITSSLPGTPLIYWIDEVIKMSDEEYFTLKKVTYDSLYNSDRPLDSFFSFKNINYNFFLSNNYVSLIYVFMMPARFLLK